MDRRLTENQYEVLNELHGANTSKHPVPWARPLDIGASNGSHHSNTLNACAKKGWVQFKQRGAETPPDGENGKRVWASRGSKSYRITPAGIAALDLEKEARYGRKA